jgi:hypothetical protein
MPKKISLKAKAAAVRAAIEKRDIDLAAIEAEALEAGLLKLHAEVLEEQRVAEEHRLAEIERLRKEQASKSPWHRFTEWFN